ncbi:ecto-ADP-ribosyltransferase 5-like isoform X2 [Kryptolebias marmoratus]|uniref:ecto-ADP-ribosyltransferase 5-like isoform X2 n=1 Tax=Kryptolebias marmoratus TaxID=37003 RepID=UPI0007F9437A|nr:ecto-ADP-ribosyltransferase 5-like isoform X2 [Kryptolebias marmoratus]XP_024866099.1 ecto-ADP-ribosyltransferase 5-like isoform X2 [Kryptolebias marmoratus]
MARLVVWTAVLLMLESFIDTAKNFVPLDMAPNCIDDVYLGCEDKMENKVKTKFLLNEKNQNRNFSLAWTEAEKYYNKKWRPKPGRKPSRTLNKEETMAIYVYTLDRPKIYLEFNDAVRSQKLKYKTTFKYHTLHFFLTSALKKLNALKPLTKRCFTSFRRVSSYFSQDVLNKQIRLGSFTSSSMGWYPRPDRYGDVTCFEIYTCFGVDISLYSKFGESEREALIPPYEVFKVAKMEKRSAQKKLPCEVVYKLVSTGKVISNLNCALLI